MEDGDIRGHWPRAAANARAIAVEHNTYLALLRVADMAEEVVFADASDRVAVIADLEDALAALKADAKDAIKDAAV